MLGTGWFGAVAAEAGPSKTVAVVGDGAVGLCAVLAARRLGAHRVIAMSRHKDRQELARRFGATDIVGERGEDGVARIKELTDGLGVSLGRRGRRHPGGDDAAHPRHPPRGHIGYLGVSHGVTIDGLEPFFTGVHLHGGPAPVRRFLPELIDLIMSGQIAPGDVFDLTLSLEDAADAYAAMTERRATKVLLTL